MLARRDFDQTRRELLDAAYQEIHRYGFQAASISRILAHCQVTKGALYHHFPNKKALGLAVLDERIAEEVKVMWWQPLRDSQDPLDSISRILEMSKESINEELITLGCPLNNIAQEMSPVDEDFRDRIHAIYDKWQQSWTQALQRGQQQQIIRGDIDAAHTAAFMIAALEGAIGLAKTASSIDVLHACAAGMTDYLATLRKEHE